MTTRDYRLNIHLSPEEKASYRECAKSNGLTMGTYLRMLILNPPDDIAPRESDAPRTERVSTFLSKGERWQLENDAARHEMNKSDYARTLLEKGCEQNG